MRGPTAAGSEVTGAAAELPQDVNEQPDLARGQIRVGEDALVEPAGRRGRDVPLGNFR